MIGTILGNRYEIIEKIGEGGMADVYKAKCQKLNRYDAVKILKKEFINDNTLVEKFTKEATAIANLSDNNIVNVLDVGTQGDIHYIVMEYVNGKTLKQIIREEGKLSYEKVLDYGIQIAKALDCAHRNNIIHRDVKPQNILVTNDGVVKVTDFGIAKSPNSETITNTSRVMGSAHYFSPEQAKGNYVDYRSDIYSFGVVLYEMITGRLPFDAESPVSVALKHIQEPVVPPIIIDEKIPESLNKLILKAMEKEPIKRYQSVKEILNDLLKIQKNAEVNIVSNDIDEDFTRVMKPITEKDLKNEENKKKLAAKKDEDDDDEDDYYEEDDEDRKSKKKKYLIFSLVGVLVIALGVIVAALVLKPSEKNKSEEIVVPKIIGLSQEEAKKVLESKGLKMVIGGSEPSDEPEGTVIKVYPGEGEKAQEKVRVTISGGANKLTAPDLKDLDKNKAEEYLKNAGLVLGSVTEDYSDDVTKGNVVRQNPAPDTEVKKGDKVDIVLSKGPKISLSKVPNLIGKTENEAETLLRANKLILGKITTDTEITHDESLKGKIKYQNPGDGIEVREGSAISVVMYNYKEKEPEKKVEVPRLKGMTISAAKGLLVSKGLSLNPGDFKDDDIIKSYDKNGLVEPGTTITITEVEKKNPVTPPEDGKRQ
ncbi:Stk1 family PASTA domain-containing Ser/Thr kinase [Clostridium cadaveris]|uniref:Stk1 family PASTA domain-containing Ser/Thr kinase n=1 Tax=Clostridium cadaveris TaxID=1529 RepID=UPI0039A0889E